ncbi:MAG: nucleoside transporter C-terminal domain-containing protein [Myxococcota bacterium]
MTEISLRAISCLGFFVLLLVAWLLSNDRSAINRRMVGIGVAIQFLLAIVLLATPVSGVFFSVVKIPIEILIEVTRTGVHFVFGPLAEIGSSFALDVLPVIIFMGSLFSILYYLGWIQPIVHGLARMLARTMRLSGAEALAAIANIFVGLIESGVVIRPYLGRMTRSELFTFMTLGMSTIAGSVLIAYVTILGGGDFAGHLVVASLISAPAALVVAKIMIPESETPETLESAPQLTSSPASSLIDAAAEGGIMGMRLALNIGALLIAFVALVALANLLIGGFAGLFGYPDLSLQGLLGIILTPLAWLMGVPWTEASEVAGLIGLKTVVNEFVAYEALARSIANGVLSERSAIIASYALCGFANFGSLAILLGGIHGIAPERRAEAASLGLRSILAGTLATCMTGCLAGLMT